jgi:hypothetical protein
LVARGFIVLSVCLVGEGKIFSSHRDCTDVRGALSKVRGIELREVLMVVMWSMFNTIP